MTLGQDEPSLNPYSEAWFQILTYASVFPDRFGSLADAGAFMDWFVQV